MGSVMTAARSGVWMVLAACVVWGLAPMYYRHLGRVPAPERMAHRTIWSLVFFGAMLAVQGRLGGAAGPVAQPRVRADRPGLGADQLQLVRLHLGGAAGPRG